MHQQAFLGSSLEPEALILEVLVPDSGAELGEEKGHVSKEPLHHLRLASVLFANTIACEGQELLWDSDSIRETQV